MDYPRIDYKKILIEWAERHNITPAELQKVAGYSYQHAWNLLRGTQEVTASTIGQILASFPAEVGQELYNAISLANPQ